MLRGRVGAMGSPIYSGIDIRLDMPFGMTRIFLGLIARHTLATDLPIYESFYETVATISALCAVSYIIWVKTRITIWTVCHNDSPFCGTKNRTCAIHKCCSR